MAQQTIIRIKALILFTIFSLNTVISFACSLGVNMGFNRNHHQHKTVKFHHGKQTSQHKSNHSTCTGNPQESEGNTENDDCCSNGVVKFQMLDKAFEQNKGFSKALFDFTSYKDPNFSHSVVQIEFVKSNTAISNFFHPPPEDIRISIQRFQI